MRNGYVPFPEASVSIASSPVLYGLSVYTVCRATFDKKSGSLYVFRLRDHFERLVTSAKIMDFNTFVKTWDYSRFEKMVKDLLIKNKIKEDVLVRISVFVDEIVAGTKIHDLKHSISAYAYPTGAILPSNGINVCVSSWRRNIDNAIPSRAKVNGGYANVSLMKNEAILNGFDDALSLDDQGHVCEGTVANLFLVKNNVLITPHTGSDILEGITRNSILTIASDMGISIAERVVDRTELYTADEAFISGSSANIIPILSIDKREVSKGAGAVTAKLRTVYEKILTDISSPYSQWLTKI